MIEPESPRGSSRESSTGETSYLFDDLAIAPPLEEFRRLYQKKMRSFESEGQEQVPGPYAQAFRLGESKILHQLGLDSGNTDSGEDTSC